MPQQTPTPWYALPVTQGYRPPHYGVDIGTPFHTPITALLAGIVERIRIAADGVIVYVRSKLRSGATVMQRYVHLDLAGVQRGQTVRAGTVLGLSGGQLSGGLHPASPQYSTAAHTHYDLQRQDTGAFVNPMNFLDTLRAAFGTGNPLIPATGDSTRPDLWPNLPPVNLGGGAADTAGTLTGGASELVTGGLTGAVNRLVGVFKPLARPFRVLAEWADPRRALKLALGIIIITVILLEVFIGQPGRGAAKQVITTAGPAAVGGGAGAGAAVAASRATQTAMPGAVTRTPAQQAGSVQRDAAFTKSVEEWDKRAIAAGVPLGSSKEAIIQGEAAQAIKQRKAEERRARQRARDWQGVDETARALRKPSGTVPPDDVQLASDETTNEPYVGPPVNVPRQPGGPLTLPTAPETQAQLLRRLKQRNKIQPRPIGKPAPRRLPAAEGETPPRLRLVDPRTIGEEAPKRPPDGRSARKGKQRTINPKTGRIEYL